MHAPVRGAGLASILLTFVVTGCHDEFPTPTSPNRGVEMAPAKALAPGPTRPDEARLAHFAALIPGFGGLSYGPDGELLVYLTDLAQSKAAEAALAQLADNSHAGGPKSGTITIRQGRYDFFQLQGWRDHLTDPLLNIPGVASLDLDEGENRLTVGLADPSAQALAQEKLREFGIPLEAVAFVPMGYPDASAPVVSGPYL
ncbi:MAG TPA: hypothetical protein VFI96_06530, partial [Longimicrobiaceae bacterium]|nr:hypothetical protein [Longimicrobiaceae bacterium]